MRIQKLNEFKKFWHDARFAFTIARRKTLSGLIARIVAANYPPGAVNSNAQYLYRHNTHVVVYACTRTIVNHGIRVEPRQYREFVQKGIRKRELLPLDHPACRALLNPNDTDTASDIVEKILTSLYLTGNYFLYYNDEAKTLYHLRSDRTGIRTNARGFIKDYVYEVPGQTRNYYQPEQIVHGKFYDPNNDFYGLSPLKAAQTSINAHMKAQNWNLGFFDNAGMPLGMLTTEAHLNKDERDLLKKEWNELYQGYKNFGGTAIVSGGLEYKTLVPTHTEMGFDDLLTLARDEISSAFGVPSIFLNDREKANYANLREYERMLWRKQMIPTLLKIEQRFNKDLNQRFAAPGEYIRTIFDLSQVEALREDVVKEADAARIKIFSGQMSPNQAREARGEPPLEGGDSSMVPMSMVRLDQVGAVLENRIPSTGQPPPKTAVKSIMPEREKRFAHWSKTKDIILSNENKFKRLLIALFDDWAEEIKRNLDKYKTLKAEFFVEDIMFDTAAAEEMLGTLAEPIFADTAEKGGKRALATIGTETAFDVHDPRVEELLKAATQRFKEDIAEGNWARMTESLSEGINAGENIRDLSARVTDTMGREISNAPTVARTEVLPRYHEGQLEGFHQSGVCEGKEWMSAFTENTRDEHAAADGQTSDLEGFFEVGGEYLRYPGDPSGSASNIINCLCDVLPVVKFEESE